MSRDALVIRPLAALTVALTLPVALAQPATARPAAVRLRATLECIEGGGAWIGFTVRNVGPRTVRIDPDFHLQLEPVRPGPVDSGSALFVFPAPGWARIVPGEERTWVLSIGEPFEGLPGVDFSGARLLLSAEVHLRGRPHPAVRTFAFEACPPLEG
ncbi:MAG TPA: hypothetical protein VFQ40_06910 [Actinomycetota bacterium]|nr:hypothetical protein [Actinomycetota bacterium]